MLDFKVGSKIPREVEEVMGGVLSQDGCYILSFVNMVAIISLSGIKGVEIASFNGAMELGAGSFENIPFISMAFNGMEFDTVITKMESRDAEENAMNLILVDSDDLTIKGMRVLGLNHNLTQSLIDAVVALEGEEISSIQERVNIALVNVTTLQLHNKLNRQSFKAITKY